MDLPVTLIHPDSLGDTLDAVNAALFYRLPLDEDLRREAAQWIAARQGLPRSYAGMFAPTASDYVLGALTFTGEPVVSAAGAAHILSEEACHALYRLGVDAPEPRAALQRARTNIFRRIDGDWGRGLILLCDHAENRIPPGAKLNERELSDRSDNAPLQGLFCCATCSVSLWRHLLASGRADDEQRLENGLAGLKRSRDGKGRWKRFPFYYTLLALSEIDLPAARDEIHYALPTIERALRRLARNLPGDGEEESERDRRRRIVMGRALEKC